METVRTVMDDKLTVGLFVDDVSGPPDSGTERIEPEPLFNSSVDTDFIFSTGEVSEKTVMKLGVAEMMSSGEHVLVNQISQTGIVLYRGYAKWFTRPGR